LWANSDKPVSSCEFCALDIETTGINPYAARLIEIGMVRFTVSGIVSEYQTLVNPGTHIPEQVVMIHGISDDMVTDAPVMADVIDEIIEFIGDRPLIIHNSRFDLSFMEMECKRSGRAIPPWMSFDTVILSRKTFPGLLNHKLDTLCGIFNIPLSHHRALQDAHGCMEVFRKCVNKVDPSHQWSMKKLAEYQSKIDRAGIIREIPFKERHGTVINIGKPVIIKYVNGDGIATERKILPKKIFKKGKQTVVYAYCYLRDEDRYFNTDRIEEIRDIR